MPSENAERFELAIYVEPEYADAVRELLAAPNDNSLLLDFEKVIGYRLQGESPLSPRSLNFPDYGEGIAEVYDE